MHNNNSETTELQKKMTAACLQCERKDLSHNSTEDIIKNQLSAEGIKRIESFIFEAFLKQRLRLSKTNDNLSFSFGWSLGFNKYRAISYWFRFQESHDDWNNADQALVDKISKDTYSNPLVPPTILRIEFIESENTFYSQTYKKGNWDAPVPLIKTLKTLPFKAEYGTIRNTEEKHFSDARFKIAMTWMEKKFFECELKNLSIHRRLINCFLVPALGRQIVDLDAIILTPDNSIDCLEFKRKYPAMGTKSFGLDAHPHIKLIKHLDQYSINLRHIILVSPDWNKDTSPLEMLEDEKVKAQWHWLVANLTPDAIGTITMNTNGKDSGHSGEKRTQHNIKWSTIHILQKGIKFTLTGKTKLFDFLESGKTSGLPEASYEYLNSQRRTTRRPIKT